MKLQDFTGGLATRLRPQFLQVNEAATYLNVDSQVGVLAPIKAKEATPITVGQYHAYYEAQQEWVGKTVPTDFLEFQKVLYYTDRVGQPRKYDGTVDQNLGIAPPGQLTSITADLFPEVPIDITLDVDPTLTGLPREDTYYAFINWLTPNRLSAAMVVKVDDAGRTSIISEATVDVQVPTIATDDPGGLERRITLKYPKGIAISDGGIGAVHVFRLYAGTYYLVGDLLDATSTVVDSTYDISANEALNATGFGTVRGTVQYALAYYNSVDGTESATSLLSAEVDMTNGGYVNLASLPVSADSQVDKKRLYRIGNDLTSLTLVVELDNATTTYLDRLKDDELVGTLATTEASGPAPDGLSYLATAYAMLFGAVGNKLYFTEIGKPNSWPPLYFLQYEADITGIAPVANGILVFTAFRTHLVTGTGPTSLATQLLDGSQGCVAFESVQLLGGAAIWVSTDGICTSGGDYGQVLSKAKLGKLSITPIDSIVFDEVYMVLDNAGTTWAFDFGLGQIFKQFSFGVSTLAVANDELYGWSGNVMYRLLSATTKETFEYLSPRFVEGRVSELKTYKKVYIYSKGDIILKVIIDDIIVSTNVFSEDGGSTIQVPVESQRGYFIQFSIEGTGEVFEIEYEAGPRQNG